MFYDFLDGDHTGNKTFAVALIVILCLVGSVVGVHILTQDEKSPVTQEMQARK